MKKLMAMILTFAMVMSLCVVPASAAGSGVTITITPDRDKVDTTTEDAIVTYTVKAKVNDPTLKVGALTIILNPSAGLTLAEETKKKNPNFYYQSNAAKYQYNEETNDTGIFETIFSYAPKTKTFVASGTTNARNLNSTHGEIVLMTIMGKIAKGTTGSVTLGTSTANYGDPSGEAASVADCDVTPASVTITKAPITTVTASVDAPVKGQPLDTTVDIGTATGYTAAVEWYKGTGASGTALTMPTTAGADQIYSARITLTANLGETFDKSLKDDNITLEGYKITRDGDTKLLLTRNFPATGSVTVTKVQIGGTAPTLNVPEAADFGVPGTVKVPRTYSVDVHTDDGILTNPDGVKWSVSGLEDVTVDPDTGDLTISSNCPEGKIELTATYGGKSDTAKLTVFRDAPVVKWLKIVDRKTGGAPQTTIIPPVGDAPADMIDVEYEAKVYDQFSQPATITKVDWTWNHLPNHMGTLETVGSVSGLTLHVFHNTEAIPFDLTATLKANPAIKDTVKIKVENKPLEPLTVTQADTTYGTPLKDPVFTVPEGTTKTLVHYSTPTSSAYSSDTPPTNAGEYVVNVICETDTHIYTGHANFKINPKSISNMLQPITGTYTYTGGVQKPPAVVMDGTKKLTEGTDYTVSYGTNVHVFEAATVYVEGKGNYTGTFSRNFKIQPKPIDINSAVAVNRDYVEGKLDVECTVTLPVASDVKQGEHYLVFATMADDTAGTNKTVNVQVKMVKGGLGENYTLNKDTTTATVNINKINPAVPTGLKGVKGQKLSAVELPAGWTWYAPSMVMDTAGPQIFLVNYAGDANHNPLHMHSITVYVLDKTDVSSFITFPDGEKEYTGSWMEYKEASISGTNLGTGAKWNYVYTAGTGTLMTAGFPEGIGTYTVTATYEDSINFGIATATLTIVPKKVAIPAADTTVFTYDGSAKTYGIADTADYTVTGNSQTNAGDHTVTVALRDKATTAWADGTNTDKTYTFTIKQATPTGEPAYTKITTSGKTLADAGLTVTGSTLNPNAGTLEWVDDAGTVLPDTTTVAANTTYKWRFTPADANYTTLTGSIKLYHKSSSSGGGSSHSSRYTITVDSVKHGTITVSPKSAYKGDTVTITVKPDKGYELDTLKVLDKDGDKVKITEKKGKYTFTMPASKVTIKGKFVEEAPKQIFADVPVDAYCYEAVKWAASEGITGGIGNNLFAPGLPCTRGQIVTFLWRAAGSPAPKSMSSFADVPADAYYAKAVAWAVENGITGGTGNGKFSPDATCTRAQAVTFLYRASGSPAVSGSAAFSDVAADAYYASAVKWAEKNGITGGIGGGLFGSGNNCTRGQIVTFLYRSVK